MTAQGSLGARLSELEQPKAHLVELTGQTIPIRVYGSAWFHRLLPAGVSLRLAGPARTLDRDAEPLGRGSRLPVGTGRRLVPALRALLERGEVCLMAVDVPGKVDLELAGRPARVRRGIAQLALETGSPILPVVTLRRGWGHVGIIGEPIDPAGFDDSTTLTRHLVAAQAPVFLHEAEQVHAHAVDVWDDAVARFTRPKVRR